MLLASTSDKMIQLNFFKRPNFSSFFNFFSNFSSRTNFVKLL